MSLNTTTKTHTSVDLLKLNIKELNGGDQHYVSGQTITYSFFNFSNSSIFNNYQNAFGVNVSHDPNIWTNNPNWVSDVDSVLNGVNEIINLTFNKTSNFAASDIRWTAVNDLAGTSITGYSFLTPSMDMDRQGGNDAGILLYNKSPFHQGSGAEAEVGGSNERTVTILHEFGHFLGLSHPHVGNINNSPFPELNDSKYDMLSYIYTDENRKVAQNGLVTASAFNFGTFVNYTPLNIAQLQYLYGANTTTHTSNTSYTLTDAGTVARDLDGSNGTISIGRAYYSIWDNGGDDEIKYNGGNRVLINLNAATLNRTTNDTDLVETLSRLANSDYYGTLLGEYRVEITDSKYYAGGFFSQILTNDDSVKIGGTAFNGKYANTLGGYTIANGVVIENATGGSGQDLIIGNAANNTLSGNGGNDTIFDGNGHDTVLGGAGDDIFYVGKGNDSYDGGANTDKADFASVLANYQIFVVGGNAIIQDITGNKYGSNSFVDVENFTFSGVNITLGALPVTGNYERLYADLLNNEFVADAGGIDGNYNDTFWGTAGVDSFFGELLNDLYTGNTGSDKITFKGNIGDYNYNIGDGSQLIVTSNADATRYDILHSVELLQFDSILTFVSNVDLGLSPAQYNTWLADFDYG